MSSFEAVASVDELSNPGKMLVEIQDRLVLLVKVDDQIYCIDDVCTHDGGSFDDGDLSDHAISCPRHGAQFDVRTGQPLTMPATEATAAHEVKIVDGKILVRLSDEDDDRSTNVPPAELAATPAVDSPASAESEATGSEAPTSPEPQVAVEATANSDDVPAGSATGELTEDVCREELKKVIDPELFVNIVDLGLIYTVAIADAEAAGPHNVAIDMTMTSPMCPAGPQLIANSKQVLLQLDSVADVEVKVVMDPPWTPDKMTDDARDQLGIF